MKIPPRYSEVSYEDVPREVKDRFSAIRSTRRGIYLCGDVGTGKTHIAYALAKQWNEEGGKWPLFHNTTELLRDIRAEYDRMPGDKEYPEERIIEHRGLLILDDVGSEKVTDWVAETFYFIVNHRYNEKLPMIITSNLPVAELADRVGDRTASRIVDSCDIIELKGSDRRLLNHKKITVSL